MAIKLPTNANSNWATKMLWKKRQGNEHTRVDNYKEGVCFVCFSRKAVSATLVDICEKCDHKRGREAALVNVVNKYYGLCYFCGDYKFHIDQVNVRLCNSCYGRVNKILRKFNKDGGTYGSDPFWKSLRKKHGKDWKQIMFSNPARKP